MPKVDSFVEAGKLIAHLVEVKKHAFLLDTWTDLVNSTPIDSGKARASWFISPGRPHTRELPPGTYTRPSAPELSKYKRHYTKWFLANTAHYIEYLNNGHSQQAPAGFVDLAIQRQVARHG